VGQAAALEGTIDWQTVVPANAVVGGYYVQAINKDAPHPAAARLWQEFLYSDEGQNLWLAGGARPVRADAMSEAGTIDTEAYQALPEVVGDPVVLTAEQNAAAQEYLQQNWAGAVG
jgi:putative spermidine/putrescine transport system substrate-binding protein